MGKRWFLPIKNHAAFSGTVVFFLLVYSAISLFNYYLFRTAALDLGLYAHAMHEYAHLRMATTAMFQEHVQPLLGDHFDLLLMLFAPLTYISGPWMLLVIQLFFILTGGAGVYYFFISSGKSKRFSLLAAIHFYTFFGIFAALRFDYHSNVIAAMLVPWFLSGIYKRNLKAAIILFILIIIARENMSLWMIFICAGALLIFKERPQRRMTGVFLIVSLIYFMLITGFVMPALNNAGQFVQLKYHVLGNSTGEALHAVLHEPVRVVKLLFINHSGQAAGDGVKGEFWIYFICSGGVLLLRKPAWLVMLIPVFFQKLLHDNITMWSVCHHYCIELAPVISIGAFVVLDEMKHQYQRTGTVVLLLLSAGVTIRLMDHTRLFYDKATIRFYKKDHYTRTYQVSEIHRELKTIPGEAAVCAQSPFVPQLSYRKKIYMLPFIHDAGYLVWSEKEEPYPFDAAAFKHFTDSVMASGKWIEESKAPGFHILKKKQANGF